MSTSTDTQIRSVGEVDTVEEGISNSDLTSLKRSGENDGEGGEEVNNGDMTGEDNVYYYFSRTAYVLVGQNKVRFTVHPDIVCERSLVLARAMDQQWNPGNKPVELPDDDPVNFDGYLECVYSGKVDDDDYWHTDERFMMYVLADKLGDLTTANLIIDSIIRYSEHNKALPDLRSIRIAYEKLPDSSPLRSWLAHNFASHASDQCFDDLDESFPAAFLADLCKASNRLAFRDGRVEQPTHTNKCKHHMHDASHPVCDVGTHDRTDKDERPAKKKRKI